MPYKTNERRNTDLVFTDDFFNCSLAPSEQQMSFLLPTVLTAFAQILKFYWFIRLLSVHVDWTYSNATGN